MRSSSPVDIEADYDRTNDTSRNSINYINYLDDNDTVTDVDSNNNNSNNDVNNNSNKSIINSSNSNINTNNNNGEHHTPSESISLPLSKDQKQILTQTQNENQNENQTSPTSLKQHILGTKTLEKTDKTMESKLLKLQIPNHNSMGVTVSLNNLERENYDLTSRPLSSDRKGNITGSLNSLLKLNELHTG